jgi:hypothetical protein
MIDAEAVTAAKAAFDASPSLATAAMYFSKAREAEECGVIGDDEWLNACADIEAFLWVESEHARPAKGG